MPRRAALLRRAALGLLALVLLPLLSSATTFVRVADGDLVDGARLIVVAEVASVDEGAGARRLGTAATEVGLRVEEVLKGKVEGGHLRVRIPGGVAPHGERLRLSGAPAFARGERVLLFLNPSLEGGRDGSWRIAHFLLGAFHQLRMEGRPLAYRLLGGAAEVRRADSGGLAFAAGDEAEPLRDFPSFAAWVRRRAAGERPPQDYLRPAPDSGQRSRLEQGFEKYRVFVEQDGIPVRWFDFDSGGTVTWRSHQTGQAGLAGGGVDELGAAMACWNSDPTTPIRYEIGGTTSATSGFAGGDDGLNTVLWNDPNDEIDPFGCDAGGVLAIGGPWSELGHTPFNGLPYHRITSADVVFNSGLECYFAGYDRPGGGGNSAAEALLGHELGHTLGLDHSAAGGSLMQAALTFARRAEGCALAPDDAEGIDRLYNPNAAPVFTADPDGLTAAVRSASAVELQWVDHADSEDGYRVEARAAGEGFREVASLPPNAYATVLSELEPATDYTFRVRASGRGAFSGYSNEATARTLDDGGGGGHPPCTAGPARLCLDHGRFAVTVAWQKPGGESGVGSVVPVGTADSGLFWFFAPANWELMVKVLDGCGVNRRHWVFFGAASNVEYTLTVLDTQNGEVKAYHNPQGRVAPVVTDTDAFAGCPP